MEETITLSRIQPWDQLRSLRRATTRAVCTVHVTPGGVATEEDVRAPRRPHNWSSELLWPYWKATEERPTTNHHFMPLHLADIPPLSPEVKEKMSTDAVLLHDLSQYVNTSM